MIQKRFTSIAFTAALGALTLGALATAPVQAQTAAAPVRGVLGLAATFGGDDLVTTQYTNGSSSTISAGGLLQIKLGAEFQLAPQFALQTTVGYHFDRRTASNGDVTFERYPLEALAFYQLGPQFRLGAGLRSALNPKLSGTGAASSIGNNSFSSKLAAVVEAEYAFSPVMSVTFRAVNEKYTFANQTINGSHGGIGINFYF